MKKFFWRVFEHCVFYLFLGALFAGAAACEQKMGQSTWPANHWSYKTLVMPATVDPGAAANGVDMDTASVVPVDEGTLNQLGKDGWELSASWLEMETVFPNFGKGAYVTGLQPNVRPRRVVLVFKKQLP